MYKFFKVGKFEFTTCNMPMSDRALEALEYGVWESSEVELCKRYLKPDDVILELGACIGVVSAVANSMLSNKSNHVAVEANPVTAKVLGVNKEKNASAYAIENCLVFREHSGKYYPASGAPQSGSTMIHNDGLGHNAYEMATLCAKVDSEVKKEDYSINQFDFDFVHLPVVTVEQLEEKHQKKFNVLIIDIEGGEFQFLEENKSFLNGLDLVIIEFHQRFDIDGCNEGSYKNALSTLSSAGLVELKNSVSVPTISSGEVRNKTMMTATEVWGRP